MRISDWSSDVCSSDLFYFGQIAAGGRRRCDRSVMVVPTLSQSASPTEDDARSLSSEIRPTTAPFELADLHRNHSGRLLRFFTRPGARQDDADLVHKSFVRLALARAKRGAVIPRPEPHLPHIDFNH